MEPDPIQELLAEYALGTLDADEQARVERHLAQCADCRRLLAEYQEVAGALPQALAAVSPWRLPSAAKTRLLQSLKADALPSPRSPSRDGTPGAAAAPRPGRPGRAWWRRPQLIGGLAAALLVALSLLWSLQLGAALAQERALRAEYANLVSRQEVVLEVVDSSKTVKRVLRPPGGGSPAYGKLYTRPDLAEVVVMAARLSPPPPGQAYHLWLTSEGQTHLAGVLAVNDQGFGLLVFEADRPGPAYEAAQLTLQAEGATAPAGPPILAWEASSG